ncbi:MAG: DUF4238 domain-containing protein [Proteobacteria bacterium]|nr:MAG: DUF4238 domain-containing protein [Pseudomonadota bacterium]
MPLVVLLRTNQALLLTALAHRLELPTRQKDYFTFDQHFGLVMQSKPQNPSRKHHILPRFYLRGFAMPTDPTSIWVYRRGKIYLPGKSSDINNPCPTSIKKTAMKLDYFSYLDVNGLQDYETIEHELQKRESTDAALLRKMIGGEKLPWQEREDFCRFIFLIYFRSPARQLQFPKLWGDVYGESFLTNLINEIEVEIGKPLKPFQIDLLRNVSEYSPEDVERVRQQSILNKVPRCVDALVQMRWTVIHAPLKSYFITSDNPVLFTPLGGPDAELFFPLSSRLALWATNFHVPTIGTAHVNESFVQMTNSSVCQAALSQTYACRQSGDLVRIFNEYQSG